MAEEFPESKTNDWLSAEEEDGWDRKFTENHPEVSQVKQKKDPRPKYNIFSWLLFL